jgi:hypothetical protein
MWNVLSERRSSALKRPNLACCLDIVILMERVLGTCFMPLEERCAMWGTP